jgi:hypothetical protein
LVESDVIEGYVSLKKAREDYGIIINPKTMKIDTEATRRLRRDKAEVKSKAKIKAKGKGKGKG